MKARQIMYIMAGKEKLSKYENKEKEILSIFSQMMAIKLKEEKKCQLGNYVTACINHVCKASSMLIVHQEAFIISLKAWAALNGVDDKNILTSTQKLLLFFAKTVDATLNFFRICFSLEWLVFIHVQCDFYRYFLDVFFSFNLAQGYCSQWDSDNQYIGFFVCL